MTSGVKSKVSVDPTEGQDVSCSDQRCLMKLSGTLLGLCASVLLSSSRCVIIEDTTCDILNSQG